MLSNYIWIVIFGILGVLARYQTGLFIDQYNTTFFPWATLTVNLIGAFLMGFVYVLLINGNLLPSHISLAIMIGFLGGFTTFSSLTLDVYKLVNASQVKSLAIYLLVTLTGGILLTFLGAGFAKILFKQNS